MMQKRDFKFRVWDNQMYYPSYKLVTSNGDSMGNPCLSMGLDECSYISSDAKIQQFTGLKDKNNRDIFEGDIIQTRYTSRYEILDESGNFIKWSDDEKDFKKYYKVIWYCGDYEINCSEYTIGLNGFVAQLEKDTRLSTLVQTGSIKPLSIKPLNSNYGFFGLVTSITEVIGNIFENPELLTQGS